MGNTGFYINIIQYLSGEKKNVLQYIFVCISAGLSMNFHSYCWGYINRHKPCDLGMSFTKQNGIGDTTVLEMGLQFCTRETNGLLSYWCRY